MISLAALSVDSISAAVGAAVATAAFTVTGIVRPISKRAKATLERSLLNDAELRQLHDDVRRLVDTMERFGNLLQRHEVRISQLDTALERRTKRRGVE